jgi:hypothetical protein
VAQDPAELVLSAAREVLGSRLDTFVKYGSSATGELLLRSPTWTSSLEDFGSPIALADTLALQNAIAAIDPEPYHYFQAHQKPRALLSGQEPRLRARAVHDRIGRPPGRQADNRCADNALVPSLDSG